MGKMKDICATLVEIKKDLNDFVNTYYSTYKLDEYGVIDDYNITVEDMHAEFAKAFAERCEGRIIPTLTYLLEGAPLCEGDMNEPISSESEPQEQIMDIVIVAVIILGLVSAAIFIIDEILEDK